MSFHEVQFPPHISYGSKGGPGFKTDVITTDSGVEQRTPRWAAARRKYDVSTGIRSQSDLNDLITFYICRSGVAYGFRFKDFMDFTSAANNQSTATTQNDQEIGLGDGTTTAFQLIKSYVSGPVTRTRNITKPVTGTVTVGLDGTLQASGWTVDTTTGVVTFAAAPGAGVVVSAGFQFDVPVRFADELDDNFPVTIEAFDSASMGSLQVVEIKDEVVNSDLFYYGGAEESNPSADVQLQLSSGRLQIFVPTTTGLSVKMPATTALPAGGPYFVLVNEGSHDMAIKTSAGASIVTLTAGQSLMMVLSVDASHVKYWYAA